jgi:hypothetical protein
VAWHPRSDERSSAIVGVGVGVCISQNGADRPCADVESRLSCFFSVSADRGVAVMFAFCVQSVCERMMVNGPGCGASCCVVDVLFVGLFARVCVVVIEGV